MGVPAQLKTTFFYWLLVVILCHDFCTFSRILIEGVFFQTVFNQEIEVRQIK